MRVLLFGTFDLFHPGHRFVLEEARKRGEVFVVIARDATVERLKGRPPQQREQDRLQAIISLFPDVRARLGDPQDYLAPLRAIQPDLILLGYDQRLPPGVSEQQLGAPVKRLSSFQPHRYKSSVLRGQG